MNELEDTKTLQPQTGYMVVVRAENAYGTGWPSEPVSFTTKTVPSTPELVNDLLTSRSITVKWNQYSDGGDAIAYKIYCKGEFQTGGGGGSWEYTEQTLDNRTTSLSHTFEDLTPGQAYNFWVKAVTSSNSDTGPSLTTNIAYHTLEDNPDTPADVSVRIGDGSDRSPRSRKFSVRVKLPYHNKACNKASCSGTRLEEIEVSINPPGTKQSIFTISPSNNLYENIDVTELEPNVQYSIEVRVKSSVGWSLKNTTISHRTCDEAPEQISTVSALNGEKTNTSITLRWEAPVDGGTAITRFRVRSSRANYIQLPHTP